MKVLPFVANDAVVLLSDGLRDQDLAELAALGRTPSEAVWQAVAASGALVFTAHVHGRPAGIFGACTTDEVDVGGLWMLGSEQLVKGGAGAWVREGRIWIKFLHRVYPTLTNYIHEENDKSWRWLELLGFEFPFEDDFMTEGGEVFRRFIRCVTP